MIYPFQSFLSHILTCSFVCVSYVQWVAHGTKIIISSISSSYMFCISWHLFPNSSPLKNKYFRLNNTYLKALVILRPVNVYDYHLEKISTRTIRKDHLNNSFICASNNFVLTVYSKTLSVCSVNRCATRSIFFVSL